MALSGCPCPDALSVSLLGNTLHSVVTIEAVRGNVQANFCPEGVVAVCVAAIQWLNFSDRSINLNGKTHFAFVTLDGAPDWLKPGVKLSTKGE